MTRDSDDRRRRYALGLVPALVAALVLVCLIPLGLYDGLFGGPGNGSGQASLQGDPASFTISGSVEHISPGLMAPLDLKFTNPHDESISLTDLHVGMGAVDAPNADADHPCGSRDFVVAQASTDLALAIAPGTSRTLSQLGLGQSAWPHVGMVDGATNQDGCKGAIMTLLYSATGVIQP